MKNKQIKPRLRFKKELGFTTTQARSDMMRKIKGNNTKPEVLLRQKLWSYGVRYRKNVKKLYGVPDIVINKYRLAIFIDGEFWHGFDWEQKRHRIKSNCEFWIDKIEHNMHHDREVNHELSKAGYVVLRFWANQVQKDTEKCASIITEHIKECKIN